MNLQYAYQSAPANFMPMMMAGGGMAAAPQQKYGLASAAEELRSRGREGDTILAHINPQEAGILQLLGGSGTINPYTGLPEYRLKLKKLIKPIVSAAAFVASGGNPYVAAAAAGAVDLAQGKKPEEALKSAVIYGGTAGIGQGLNILPAQGAPIYGDITAAVTPSFLSSGPTAFPAANQPVLGTAGAPAAAGGSSFLGSIADLAGSVGKAVIPTSGKEALNTALLGTLGYGGVTSAQETKEQRKLAEAELARQQQKIAEQRLFAETNLAANPFRFRRLNREDIERTGLGMPQNYLAEIPSTVSVASGGRINFEEDYDPTGVASLVKGGLPPRYLRGGGDGMSDSIPARIGGRQEARLADGEFVIPADVVSHIGNGSSNAGAKKLYAMMDRIRKARTGSTRQAPAVKTNRLMPA